MGSIPIVVPVLFFLVRPMKGNFPMATKEKVKFAVSPIGRVSFPSVFEPTSMDEKQDKKYSLTLLFPKGTDLKALKDAANKCAKEKWPKGLPASFRSPFRDGGEKENLDGYEEGVTFVKFSGKYKPEVADQKKRPIGPDDFYAGCWARCTWTVYAYDQSGNKGVAFGLVNIQKAKDDEPFGLGSSSAEEDFDELEVDDELADLLS